MSRENVVKREDLAQKMVAKFNMTKKEALEVLNFLVDEITTALKEGKQVKLVGLGTFKVRMRKEREVVNQKTGERMKVPAMRVPKFTAAKTLKEAVRG
ncbi:MAG: DNA-binding protein [Patescibacteria group bacterium]